LPSDHLVTATGYRRGEIKYLRNLYIFEIIQ
jgi:hypothetical protein